ncbi:MAG: antitoxin Xre/MbcA/ParS toxin-binding domain-containing protein [Bacteroidota bacterium]
MINISKILSDTQRGIKVESARDYIELSRKGLTMNQLRNILQFTSITLKDIASILSISERQLSRYEDSKILRTDISAQLIQITELYQFGYDVFEGRENFQGWMKTAIRALDYQRPIELLDTPFGIQDVKNVIGRLEYGVYS